MDPQGAVEASKKRLALGLVAPLSLEVSLKDTGFPPCGRFPTLNPEIASLILYPLRSSCTNSTSATYQTGSLEAFMAKPQGDSGEFLMGPRGEDRKWWRQHQQRPGAPTAKWPQAHSFGESVQCSHGAQLWQDLQCPAATDSQPFDSPLMPREDLLHPVPRNVCPTQSVPPLGGSHGASASPENRR